VRATYAEITIDAAIAASWGRLAAALRDAGRATRVNDLWIAATALVHGAAIVTRDRDYETVRDVAASELRVIELSRGAQSDR
jgi:predicted nucleic acid-binding protein